MTEQILTSDDLAELLLLPEEILGELTDVVPEAYRPASMFEHGLDWLGLEPHTEPEKTMLPFYAKMGLLVPAAAWVISYYRNQDARWATVHAFMGPYYLGYVVMTALAADETYGLRYLFKR
jgi:hypothetical protein